MRWAVPVFVQVRGGCCSVASCGMTGRLSPRHHSLQQRQRSTQAEDHSDGDGGAEKASDETIDEATLARIRDLKAKTERKDAQLYKSLPRTVRNIYISGPKRQQERIRGVLHGEPDGAKLEEYNIVKRYPPVRRDLTLPDRPTNYTLTMFPYPSGSLHMGHLRVYAIGDTIARIQRMRTYMYNKVAAGNNPNRRVHRDVIFPIGWDAFGLPAENAAIERNEDPREWTRKNIDTMRSQLKEMACSFDWDREINTCEPEYYKWTQYLFLQLFKHGLVYRANAVVNWDPVDKTVLANEQVDSQGRAERSGALVEQRELEQWFVKTTEYADSLYEDLDVLKWPRSVVQQQQKWIGKTDGWTANFHVVKGGVSASINAFFESPLALRNASYIALAYDHPLIEQLNMKDAAKNIVDNATSPTRSSLGYDTGLKVKNPLTSQVLPVFLSGRVPGNGFGTRAWCCWSGVAGDASFAKRFEIPSIEVQDASSDAAGRESADSEFLSHAKAATFYKLRDWLISRQRFWGTPIPMVHCPSCGIVPVPEKELPVKLPEGVVPSLSGGSPLAHLEDWVNCKCPKCKGPAKRETDTMDTFFDSSWYWLRYLDPKNEREICHPDHAVHLPVTTYVGGAEHSILHLLYARFMGKFLLRSGIVGGLKSGTPEWDAAEGFRRIRGEPFEQLVVQGLVTGRTAKCPETDRYLKPSEVEWKGADQAIVIATGKPAVIKWEKMSKSKYNGVNPTDLINEFGLDVVRLFVLSRTDPTMDIQWDPQAIIGMARFLERMIKLISWIPSEKWRIRIKDNHMLSRYAKHIRTIEAYWDKLAFHNMVSEMIKFSITLEGVEKPDRGKAFASAVNSLRVMVSAFAPHFGRRMGFVDVEFGTWPHIFGPDDRPEIIVTGNERCQVTIDKVGQGAVRIPTVARSDSDEIERLCRTSYAGRNLWTDDGRGGLIPRKVRQVLVAHDGLLCDFTIKRRERLVTKLEMQRVATVIEMLKDELGKRKKELDQSRELDDEEAEILRDCVAAVISGEQSDANSLKWRSSIEKKRLNDLVRANLGFHRSSRWGLNSKIAPSTSSSSSPAESSNGE